MRTRGPRFRDRDAAGRALAEALLIYRAQQPAVLALPRGGVPVAYPIALALAAPLGVLPVRKLGAPDQPELGVGAIALGGPPVLDRVRMDELGISPVEIAAVEAAERQELERQARLFAADRQALDLGDRTAIVVDDGLATGVSALAAVRAVRASEPRRLVLAVPVGARDTLSRLRGEVDDLVCLETPEDFFAVGAWYRDFRPVSDTTVLELLDRASAARC